MRHAHHLVTIALAFALAATVVVAVTNLSRANDWKDFNHSYAENLERIEAENAELRERVIALTGKVATFEDGQTADRTNSNQGEKVAAKLEACVDRLRDGDGPGTTCSEAFIATDSYVRALRETL